MQVITVWAKLADVLSDSLPWCLHPRLSRVFVGRESAESSYRQCCSAERLEAPSTQESVRNSIAPSQLLPARQILGKHRKVTMGLKFS